MLFMIDYVIRLRKDNDTQVSNGKEDSHKVLGNSTSTMLAKKNRDSTTNFNMNCEHYFIKIITAI